MSLAGTPRATRSSRVLSEITTNGQPRYARGIRLSSASTYVPTSAFASRNTVVPNRCGTTTDTGVRVHHGSRHGALLMSSTIRSGRSAPENSRRTTPGTSRLKFHHRPRRTILMPRCSASAPAPGNDDASHVTRQPQRSAASSTCSRCSSAPPASGWAGSRKLTASRWPLIPRSPPASHRPDHVAGVERPAPVAEPLAQPVPRPRPALRPARMERQPHAEPALEDFAHDAIPQAGHHPFAVAAHHLEARLAHQALEPGQRELRLPAREPAIHEDERLLHERVEMERLRHVHEHAPAGPGDARVLGEQRARVAEVLEQALVERDVDRAVAERHARGVRLHEQH